MGLIDDIKDDIQQITSDLDGFGWPLKFTARTGEIAEVVGLFTKHHMGMDSDGLRKNFKNAHASCSEKLLMDLGYPVRNAARECQMKGDFLEATDSTGQLWEYKILEVYPDETIGLIVFMLGDYE